MRKIRLTIPIVCLLVLGSPWTGVGQETTTPTAGQSLDLMGIGVKIAPPPPNDEGKQIFQENATILIALPHGPAALSGEVSAGDIIVAIGEGDAPAVPVQGQEFSRVIQQIRGPAGTEVRLTIIPADNRFVKMKVVSIPREPLLGGNLIGDPVPEARLTSVNDASLHALSDFRGKILVLEFWDSHCVPCIQVMDDMQTYAETHPHWNDQVALVAVSLDEDLATVKETISVRGWTNSFNAWGDESLKSAIGVDLLPMVIIVDREGQVVLAGNPRAINIPSVINRLLKNG